MRTLNELKEDTLSGYLLGMIESGLIKVGPEFHGVNPISENIVNLIDVVERLHGDVYKNDNE